MIGDHVLKTGKDIVFVKLGGSFITYKDKFYSINFNALKNSAKIIREVIDEYDILLGNGGGSFAHPIVLCSEEGSTSTLVKCQEATRDLNHLIVDYLVNNGIPAVSFQTSAIIYEGEQGLEVFAEPIKIALRNNVVPVVYGECIHSLTRVFRILSTEDVFLELSKHIRPVRVVLLTNVKGVYNRDPTKYDDAELIRIINKNNYKDVIDKISKNTGTDATGGIVGKVIKMYNLSCRIGAPIHIVSGFDVENTIRAIKGEEFIGTTIKYAD